MFSFLSISRIFLMTFLIVGGGTCAYASDVLKIPNDLVIWNPDAVTWSVDANSAVDDICQIHWIYDDEIDVYVKQNKDNLFYFGMDYLGNEKNFKQLFNSGDFKTILVVDEEQIELGSQRVDSNKIIAIAPTVINSLDVLKQSEALFLKSSEVLYSFPLENTTEIFSVYKQCLKDNGQYVEVTNGAKDSPISESSEVTEVFSTGDEVDTSVSETAAVPKVVAAPISANGVDLLFGNNAPPPPTMAAEGENNAVSLENEEPSMGVAISPSDEQKISQSDSPDKKNPDALLNGDQSASSDQEKTENVAENVAQQDIQKSDLPESSGEEDKEVIAEDEPRKDLSVPPKGYLKGPSDFLETDLEYAEGAGKKVKDKDTASLESDKENACDNKGQVGENITGVIQNLTRKLKILEKEKEALRTKMIANMGDSSVVSEILSCKTDGAEEAPIIENDFGVTEKYEILIDGMKAEIENLRAENDLLNAAVTNKPSIGNINDAPKTAVLNETINKLEVENIQLKREVGEFKKMLSTDAVPKEEIKQDIVSEEVVDKIAPVIEGESEILPTTESLEPALSDDVGTISRQVEEVVDWGDMEKEILDSVETPQ